MAQPQATKLLGRILYTYWNIFLYLDQPLKVHWSGSI